MKFFFGKIMKMIKLKIAFLYYDIIKELFSFNNFSFSILSKKIKKNFSKQKIERKFEFFEKKKKKVLRTFLKKL